MSWWSDWVQHHERSSFKKIKVDILVNWFSVMILHPLYRGFGFVTFKDPQTVRKVLDAHNSTPISIDEKTVSLYLHDCTERGAWLLLVCQCGVVLCQTCWEQSTESTCCSPSIEGACIYISQLSVQWEQVDCSALGAFLWCWPAANCAVVLCICGWISADISVQRVN